MEYTRLGSTGMPVSRLCLGTMTFGYQCDEPTSTAILDSSFEAGITFLDVADVYPLGAPQDHNGRTEEIVGRWMKGRREQVIVATKAYGPMGPAKWDMGNSRKHLLDAIDGSLRRLGTDYVDLYQLHRDDAKCPLDETLGALDTIVRSGRARYIGCSNFLAYRLATALGRSDTLGVARFVSAQPRYNLLFRGIENELLPLCREQGVGVIPYNPIAGGMLTGKHQRGEPTTDTRFTLGYAASVYQDRYWHEAQFDLIDAMRPLAADAGVSLTTLAVAWVLANPAITAPIIGASRPEQLADSVAALAAPLDADLKKQLDDLTALFRPPAAL